MKKQLLDQIIKKKANKDEFAIIRKRISIDSMIENEILPNWGV